MLNTAYNWHAVLMTAYRLHAVLMTAFDRILHACSSIKSIQSTQSEQLTRTLQCLFAQKSLYHFDQVLLVTGGWGKRNGGGVGYHDETEIFQDGNWKNVGKLPALRRHVRCRTLSNTIFLTGNIVGYFCILKTFFRWIRPLHYS